MKCRLGSLMSTAAATLSASCCVLPVVLLVLGFTSLGPFAILMRYRPITLPLSFLLLAAAFYVTQVATYKILRTIRVPIQ
jgi:hypothetical protein